MQKLTPSLWFDDKAEEAARFYVSIFKNAKFGNIARYGEAGAQASGRPKSSVMTVTFELEGQEFVALKWRTALQIYRSGLVHGEVPFASRNR